MKTVRLITCGALIVFLRATSSSAQGTEPLVWSIEGSGYAVEAETPPSESGNSSLILRSLTGNNDVTGRVGTSVPAARAVMHRVSVSGELQTLQAPGGAALWVRVERSSGAPLADYGFNQRVEGGAEWTSRMMSIPVPPDATRISFGARLWGGGSVAVRRLRLEIGAMLDPERPLPGPVAEELQQAIDIVRTHGLRRDAVVWPTLERQVRALASGATTINEVYDAITFLLAEAADPNHSALLTPDQWAGLSAGLSLRFPDVRALDGMFGYFELPETFTEDRTHNRDYVQRAYEGIQQTAAQARCGWILDLRGNGGGNAFPMLSAVRPFLGEHAIGGRVGPDGAFRPRIAAENSDVTPASGLSNLDTAAVAVLIGPNTISAGEAVALSFRGRERTRLFGQPTRGATTSNETFALPDGARLVVTGAIMADRTGRTYGGKIEPDTFVASTSSAATDRATNDPAAIAAIEWLKQTTRCQ